MEKEVCWNQNAVWLREGWLYQIGSIFGKVPGGGPKIHVADFGNFKQAFFEHEIDTGYVFLGTGHATKLDEFSEKVPNGS